MSIIFGASAAATEAARLPHDYARRAATRTIAGVDWRSFQRTMLALVTAVAHRCCREGAAAAAARKMSLGHHSPR